MPAHRDRHRHPLPEDEADGIGDTGGPEVHGHRTHEDKAVLNQLRLANHCRLRRPLPQFHPQIPPRLGKRPTVYRPSGRQ